MRSAEHVGDSHVGIHKSCLEIHHKDDDVRHVDRDLRLFPHLGQDDIARVRFDTSGIDQCKIIIQP